MQSVAPELSSVRLNKILTHVVLTCTPLCTKTVCLQILLISVPHYRPKNRGKIRSRIVQESRNSTYVTLLFIVCFYCAGSSGSVGRELDFHPTRGIPASLSPSHGIPFAFVKQSLEPCSEQNVLLSNPMKKCLVNV